MKFTNVREKTEIIKRILRNCEEVSRMLRKNSNKMKKISQLLSTVESFLNGKLTDLRFGCFFTFRICCFNIFIAGLTFV